MTNDKDNNFLMINYIKTKNMNPIYFYRAIDTKDKDIYIPSFIGKSDYEYWK